MDNPIIQAEINYSLTLEIPLPLSLSGILPSSNLYNLFFPTPPSGGALEAGNRKFPHPLLFYSLDEPGGLRNLEILSALHPSGQSWKPETGNWKLPPTSEWPDANARRKLEAGNSSPV